MKFKIKCTSNNSEKIKFDETLKGAEKKFDAFVNSKRKGEITVFLLENTIGDRYKVVKQQVIIN